MTTQTSHKTYLLREAIVSSIINSVLSVAIFYLLFRNAPELEIGSVSKFTLDFLPQAFFVGFFSTLPPCVRPEPKNIKEVHFSSAVINNPVQ